MNTKIIFILILLNLFIFSCKGENMTKSDKNKLFNELSKEEKKVIVDKGTEKPYSGKYQNFDREGTYICKRCGLPLYKSSDKFESGCGWPSFDDEIRAAVRSILIKMELEQKLFVLIVMPI